MIMSPADFDLWQLLEEVASGKLKIASPSSD